MESKVELEQRIFWYHHKQSQRELYENEAASFRTWLSKLKRFLYERGSDEGRKSELEFLRFYLHNTKRVCTQFLTVNCCLLLGTIYLITQEQFGSMHGPIDPTFSSFQPAVVGITIWIILSLLCLAFFLVLSNAPQLFANTLVANYCDIWYEIGAAILFTRLLMLVAQIVRIVQSEDRCLDAPDLIGTGDTTFGYVFIMMCVNTYQTYVFTILPFPQPWAALFTLTELTRQLIRLYTCSHRITSQAELRWIVNLLTLMIMYAYVFMVMVPSIYLEGSFRNRFRSERLQREATASKKEMVGFLSNDVRVPLQYMLHAVASVDFVRVAGDNVQPLLNDIHRHSAMVNEIADELLLLVRINENRYTSKLSTVPDLCRLLDVMSDAFLQRRFAHSYAPGRRERTPAEARDWVIDVAAPAVEVQVDESCLVAALRHLLAHLTQPSSEESEHPHAEARGDAPEYALGLDVALFQAAMQKKMLYMVAALASNKKSVTIKVTADSLRAVKMGEESRVREATTSYVCATIAAACGGTFQRSAEAFVLTVPCVVRSTEETGSSGLGLFSQSEDGADSVGVGSFATNARSGGGASQAPSQAVSDLKHDQEALDDKIRLSAGMQERFRRKRVCAIVMDSVLEEVITAAITRMGLGAGLTVLHDLQRGKYVPVAMVTFVTTYELCVDLRGRKYSGLIVLFSGSANYLDDAQIANVDYCMPLPCSDQHIGRFIDWLSEVHAKEAAAKAESAAASGAVRRRRPTDRSLVPSTIPQRSSKAPPGEAEFAPTTDPVHATVTGVLNSTARVMHSAFAAVQHEIVSKEKWFLVARLPPGTVENYSKWKLLNPSGSWYHHSAELFVMMAPRLFMAVALETTMFKQTISSLLPAITAIMLFMLRSCVYRFILKPLGWNLHKYWLIPACIVAGYYVVSILQRTQYPDIENLSLSEFQDKKFSAGRTGDQFLYGQIMTATTSRLYALYWAQPFNSVVFILIFIRNSQILWAILRNIASVQMCEFLQMLMIQITALNLVYQMHVENAYRREFIVAYEHILARAFLDQCLEICQQDIRKPLDYLLARKGDLMKVLQHAAQSGVLTVDRALMEKLQPLHVSHALLSEMVSEFSYSQYLAPVEQNSAKVRYSAQIVHLSHCVASLVAAFSSSLEDHHVQIVAEMDPELAVVRVDWKMLSTVLTNLISAALRNIREYCIETPRRRDLLNTVFIKLTAIDSAKKVPFVTPRLMLVNVCDSSDAASRLRVATSDPKGSVPVVSGSASESDMFRYGRSMCERLVRKVAMDPAGAVFQSLYSTESSLQTVQRFTFPYHLSSQTHRAREFIQAETSLPHLTIRVQPSALLSAYDRIIRPGARTQVSRNGITIRESSKKRVVLLTCVDPKLKSETLALADRLQSHGWKCVLKYILRIPSLISVGNADCVLIDQQLELQENVSICDTVLKLRVCGFSGVIAVVLKEGQRKTEAIKDELSRSAVDADVVFFGPITNHNIQSLTVALEKKCIAQILSMSGT